MRTENVRNKKWAYNAHPKNPSFIYRQDGYELSYLLIYSISWLSSFLINSKLSVMAQEKRQENLAKQIGRNYNCS